MATEAEVLRTERDAIAVALLKQADPSLVEAVDAFRWEMLAALGRQHANGRTGWAIEDDPGWTLAEIRKEAEEHIERGDVVDAANFLVFWKYHQERLSTDNQKSGIGREEPVRPWPRG